MFSLFSWNILLSDGDTFSLVASKFVSQIVEDSHQLKSFVVMLFFESVLEIEIVHGWDQHSQYEG